MDPTTYPAFEDMTGELVLIITIISIANQTMFESWKQSANYWWIIKKAIYLK